MNKSEIIRAAIKKAASNGLHPGAALTTMDMLDKSVTVISPGELLARNMESNILFRQTMLFNKEFAKALWGERLVDMRTGNKLVLKKIQAGAVYAIYTLPSWQYHLQQMVIADDPIKYLGEHLNA